MGFFWVFTVFLILRGFEGMVRKIIKRNGLGRILMGGNAVFGGESILMKQQFFGRLRIVGREKGVHRGSRGVRRGKVAGIGGILEHE